MTMKLTIFGACGRMGREVLGAAAADGAVSIVGAVEVPGHERLGEDAGTLAGLEPLGVTVTDDLDGALAGCDAVIDFSTVEGTARLAAALERTPRPAVVAVTALGEDVLGRLEGVGANAPVIVASNLSVGAAVLRLLAARAVRALPDFDIEIVEAHHTGKRDAPSGTAMDIARAVAGARGRDVREDVVHGRRPGEGPRRDGSIGVHAVRGGTVTGEHQVMLLGESERLTLHHGAESRAIFARGAVRAALWLVGRPPGMYRVDDVVGDSLGQ
jgi:4-hydroxy-tetrahydrodipicolinate reductase